MSKGVIIVPEVPTHCRECDYFSMFCKITGTRLYYDKDGRMDNCPIRALPDYIHSGNTAYQNGHNELLEKILN